MPASAWAAFGAALEAIFSGTVDVENDTFRLVLLSDAYTPDQVTHDGWSDMSAAEIPEAGGYVAGGKPIDLIVSRSGLAVKIDGADVTWPAATITAKYAAVVRDSDGNGTLQAADIPLFVCDLKDGGAAVASSNGDFSVTMNADGLYSVTAAAL